MSARAQDITRESVPLAVVRRAVAGLLRLVFRIRVVGAEHLPRNGPVLVAGNHTGFLDGPIVFMMLPRPSAFLVKSELYAGPFAKPLAFARQIPVRTEVHRTGPRCAVRSTCWRRAASSGSSRRGPGVRAGWRVSSTASAISRCARAAQLCRWSAWERPRRCPRASKLPRFRAPVDVIFGPAFELEVTGDPRARSTIADAAEQVRRHLLAHLDAVSPTNAP